MPTSVTDRHRYSVYYAAHGHPELAVYVSETVASFLDCQRREPDGPQEVIAHMFGGDDSASKGCQWCQNTVSGYIDHFLSYARGSEA